MMCNEQQQARSLVATLRLAETCDQYREVREIYGPWADDLAREIADALIAACNWEDGA